MATSTGLSSFETARIRREKNRRTELNKTVLLISDKYGVTQNDAIDIIKMVKKPVKYEKL